MPAIQSLKKQLRGIRSTRKLTKAMKTISTVKFSKLNGIYGAHSDYVNECKTVSECFGEALSSTFKAANPDAPVAVVVFASNKGLCGSFNSEILNFAFEKISDFPNYLLFACGKKAVNYFKFKEVPIAKEYVLSDIPSYDESVLIFNDLEQKRKNGEISDVFVFYSEYVNMMLQRPTVCELFVKTQSSKSEEPLLIPDRQSVVDKAAITVYRALFHRIVLESAIGAQAATLTTMRSAYDTATEYCTQLESKINRLRQSAVTADVIEVSSERRE